MSLSSIITSLKSEVASVLGAEWSELNYVYELEDNNFRNASNGYGVGVTSGNSVTGTTKAITLDFGFFVVLTKTFVNRQSDANEREVLSDILDAFDLINKNVFQKKLNNSNILVVQDISYESPERVEKGTIAIRVNFTIKTRQLT